MEKYCFLFWFIEKRLEYIKLKEDLEKGLISPFVQKLYKTHKQRIKVLRDLLKSKNYSVVTYLSKNYPVDLKALSFPPLVLTLYGDLSLLGSLNKLSVVGSRDMNRGLSIWIEENLYKLKRDQETKEDRVLVSGGARGVDQAIHINAIRNKIGTIIVLPTGILKPYPKNLKNWFLNDLKEKKVLFLSPFSPYQEVKKMNFYPRNEVLAGLSSKTLILQAHKKSGTMVTAKYAADLGKDVWVLSCCPWDDSFSGNISLIEEGAYQTMDLNLFHF